MDDVTWWRHLALKITTILILPLLILDPVVCEFSGGKRRAMSQTVLGYLA